MSGFKRLLHTEKGKIFISILLGLGLAAIFRTSCKKNKCMVFRHPDVNEIKDKIYKNGNKCYSYNLVQEKCNLAKTILE
mgnify:CR=1 FL=1